MEQKPIEVFIDASVLFSASDSSRGASREIIRLAQRGQLTLVVNKLVVEETVRNLANKRTDALPSFQVIIDAVPIKVINPTRDEVLAM